MRVSEGLLLEGATFHFLDDAMSCFAEGFDRRRALCL